MVMFNRCSPVDVSAVTSTGLSGRSSVPGVSVRQQVLRGELPALRDVPATRGSAHIKLKTTW